MGMADPHTSRMMVNNRPSKNTKTHEMVNVEPQNSGVETNVSP